MKLKLLILFTAIVSLLNNYCNAQWIQTDGPYDNISVSSIYSSNSKIYALANNGLYVNDAFENRWEHISDLTFSISDQVGDSVFIADKPGIQLITLSDLQKLPMSKQLNYSTINAIKATDSCLYAAVEYAGFYKSDGLSVSNIWEAYNNGLPITINGIPHSAETFNSYIIKSIEIVGETIFCSTYYSVYKSNIHKISWTESNHGLSNVGITLLKAFNDTLFAVSANKLYMSTDLGNNWNQIDIFPSNINSISKLNGTFYITTKGNGIYKTKDLLKWTTMNEGLQNLNINTIQYVNNTLVCGSATKGFHYFIDQKWRTNNSGIICSTVTGFTATNNDLISHNFLNIFKYTSTSYWDNMPIPEMKIYNGLNAAILGVQTIGDTIFNSYGYSTPDWPFFHTFIKYTTNFGETWSDFLTIAAIEPDEAYYLYIDRDKIYRYEDDKMFYTTDIGKHWVDISLTSGYCNMFYGFLVFKNIPFALACGNAELLKLDSNNQWILSNKGLPNDRDIAFLARSEDAIYAYVNVYGMYVSRDSGQSWTKANYGLNSERLHSYTFSENKIFVTSEEGIFYSNNFGKNWNSLNDGIPNMNAGPITIYNDSLYVGIAGYGIWKRDIKGILLSIDENQTNDNQFQLYPNPASELVNIIAPNEEKVTICIVDLMGRTVYSNSFYSKTTIDITNLALGSYIIQLETNSKVFSNKLIVRK